MKKIMLLITAYFFLQTSVKAQGNLAIGIRFNPEYSHIINKNDADAGDELNLESHFAYLSFGAGALYSINSHFGVGIDILFSREGQAFSGNFTGAPLDPTAYSSVVANQVALNGETITGNYVALAELNYIKVPLMLSFTCDNTKPVYFTLLVGPQLNFLYNVAQEVNKVDHDYPGTNITPDDIYKSVTFAGMLAVGAGFNISPRTVLTARLRFDYGFTDAEKKDVMVSYGGAAPVRFYSTDRTSANTLTEGLMIGLDFKL